MNNYKYESVWEHNKVLYARLFDPTTQKSIIKQYGIDEYVPPLYIPVKQRGVDHKHHSFTNNEPLQKKTFNNIYDRMKFAKQYKDLGVTLYGNPNRDQHYITTLFPEPLNSQHKLRTWFLDIEVRSINGYASTNNPVEEISLIQFYDNYTEAFYIFGTKSCNTPTSTLGKVKYVQFPNEISLLTKFVGAIKKLNPTVICGFNSNPFDIPYITNRMKYIGLNPKMLSPVGIINEQETTTPEGIVYTKYDWLGIYLLDYRDLFMKYSYDKLPRYSLEVVATHVLGVGKVNHDEYTSLEHLYNSNYDLFVQYGLTDIELLLQIDNKLKFINTASMIAYTCGVNITDVFGTLKQWSSFMYNEALKHNRVLPLQQMYAPNNPVYLGGWVKSTPGKHNWVMSWDFSSLYPSNIRFLNIGVDTLIKENNLPQELKDLRQKYFSFYSENNRQILQSSNNTLEELQFFQNLVTNKNEITPILKKYNVTISPNGFFFTKDKESIFANLMSRLYADRKVQKKLLAQAEAKRDAGDTSQEVLDAINYHDIMQGSVLKILLNSAYGSCALEYNPFSFGKAMAAAITTTGRFANRMVAYNTSCKIAEITRYKGNTDTSPFTIQGDTDSNYIRLDSVVNNDNFNTLSLQDKLEYMKKIGSEQIDPIIQHTTAEIAEILNAYNPDVLVMEQETVADSFVSVADKRYFCRYYKSGEPKYKITGLSLIGKSTPKWCKIKLKPILELVADKNPKDIINYIESVKKEFVQQPLTDICTIKGVSSINYTPNSEGKYYQFNNESGRMNPAPFHSRGAIVHNKILDDNDDVNLERIKAGDKIYIVPLLVPNPFSNQNVVCFINPEFVTKYNISKYVDYDTLFVKNFKKNIELITEPIKWSLDSFQGVLDDFE